MKPKFYDIYIDLKNKIENNVYPKEAFLPSETALMHEYECSRYSLRSALAQLTANGYTQSLHGKGVQVIYTPNSSSKFVLGGIESFKEFAVRNHMVYHTLVKTFAITIIDEKLAQLTSFPIGEEVYYIQRIRYINGEALIIDDNYYRKKYVPDLTKEIATTSIFNYLEKTLNVKLANIQRQISIERANDNDLKTMVLNDLNCIIKITSHTYSDKGYLFEYTESRHHPDHFIFADQITSRIK